MAGEFSLILKWNKIALKKAFYQTFEQIAEGQGMEFEWRGRYVLAIPQKRTLPELGFPCHKYRYIFDSIFYIYELDTLLQVEEHSTNLKYISRKQ